MLLKGVIYFMSWFEKEWAPQKIWREKTRSQIVDAGLALRPLQVFLSMRRVVLSPWEIKDRGMIGDGRCVCTWASPFSMGQGQCTQTHYLFFSLSSLFALCEKQHQSTAQMHPPKHISSHFYLIPTCASVIVTKREHDSSLVQKVETQYKAIKKGGQRQPLNDLHANVYHPSRKKWTIKNPNITSRMNEKMTLQRSKKGGGGVKHHVRTAISPCGFDFQKIIKRGIGCSKSKARSWIKVMSQALKDPCNSNITLGGCSKLYSFLGE